MRFALTRPNPGGGAARYLQPAADGIAKLGRCCQDAGEPAGGLGRAARLGRYVTAPSFKARSRSTGATPSSAGVAG